MMTQGLELTDKNPFKDVVVHGIVRDSQGRKMSKSLGNGIDPIEIIDKYGADALRFSVLSGTTMGNDIRYMPEKLEQASNFANKIWNAAKFIINANENVKEEDVKEYCHRIYDDKTKTYHAECCKIEDKWMMNKVDKLVAEVTKNIENYDLGIALDKIYSFIWNEFCDWYIEMVKPRLYGEDYTSKVIAVDILNHALETALKLLHPFMPFVTEEIYSALVPEEKSLMMSDWPQFSEDWCYADAENITDHMKEVIRGVRNARAEMNVPPSRKAKVYVVCEDEKLCEGFEELTTCACPLMSASELAVQADKAGIADDAVSIVVPDASVYVPLEELIDFEQEIERLTKEEARLTKEIARSNGMLNNEKFVSKAPAAKVQEERDKLETYQQMMAQVKERLEGLKAKQS